MHVACWWDALAGVMPPVCFRQSEWMHDCALIQSEHLSNMRTCAMLMLSRFWTFHKRAMQWCDAMPSSSFVTGSYSRRWFRMQIMILYRSMRVWIAFLNFDWILGADEFQDPCMWHADGTHWRVSCHRFAFDNRNGCMIVLWFKVNICLICERAPCWCCLVFELFTSWSIPNVMLRVFRPSFSCVASHRGG